MLREVAYLFDLKNVRCSNPSTSLGQVTSLLFSFILLLQLLDSTNMYCQPFYHRDFTIEKQQLQLQTLSPVDSTTQMTLSTLPHHTLSPPPSPCHGSTFNTENIYNNNKQQQQISTGDPVQRVDINNHSTSNTSRWNQAEIPFTWSTPHYTSYSNHQVSDSLNNHHPNIIASTTTTTTTVAINGTEDISDADSSDVNSFSNHFRDRVGNNFNESTSAKEQMTGYTYSSINQNFNTTNNTNDNNNHKPASLFSLMSQSIEDDEDARRKRRRERNKLAASKCRFKKRQHVAFLMSESERLESSNSNLKLTLNKLQSELEQLAQVLHSHKCHFVKGNILQLSTIITPLHQA